MFINRSVQQIYTYKGKAILVQAWTDLKLPGSLISRQTALEGDKVVNPYAPTAFAPLALVSVRGCVDARAIARPEELCQ